jgi:hypothetical protein
LYCAIQNIRVHEYFVMCNTTTFAMASAAAAGIGISGDKGAPPYHYRFALFGRQRVDAAAEAEMEAL